LKHPAESSLDPADWTAFRKLAHQALDEAIDFVESVRERPVWQPVPDEARAALNEPLPLDASPLESVYAQFKTAILPYATGNIHPRFFGWVHGSGQPGNIVAEMLAAAMNSNCGGRDHGAIYVEREVIRWFTQAFGLPATASGLVVSGTSMANLIALTIARNQTAANLRTCGIAGRKAPLVAYASGQVHNSVAKALEILGLGSSSLHAIPVDRNFAIDIDALEAAIRADRSAGREPFCVIGAAGTVNTGAIDDLDRLAALCAREKLWFHVDGAFGGLCILSDKLRPRLKGIERADSIAFDFHKWAHVQYGAAAVMVRDAEAHRAAFSMQPAYLRHYRRGLAGGGDWPCDFGPELSRGFLALKVWFALKEHGARKIGRLIEQNCEQARYLAERIAAHSLLQLVVPPSLNIVCFRVLPPGLDEAAFDALNGDIAADVQESGLAAPSTTRIHGRTVIRVNITNHRTRFSDMDVLLDAVLSAARARAPQNSEASR
jgi:glutamate/tyrosine decarboxylase-like PLP-dependent enzyme